MQILEWQCQLAASGRRAAARPALILAVACLLVACGRAAPPAGDAASASAAADAGAASTSGDEPAAASDADLVSAVNAAGNSKPLTVKFRVEARPVVGMPVKIMLVLTPADQGSIDHIHASLTAGEGLLMQSPASFDLSDLKAGTPQYREVTVVPQQTGVLDLNATLLLQTDKSSQARTYSIPLIAADNSGP
jgi:hypothetical protein